MKRLSLALLVACTNNPPSPTVTVTPATADVLTCSTAQLAATVMHETDQSVTWTASPGTIDANGLYTSPMTTPMPATATVVATSVAAPDVSGDAQLTLATAFPSAAVALAGTPGNSGALGTEGVFQHQVVARGQRAYAVWPVNPANGTSVSLHVARSDDGGATFDAGVDAFTAMLKAPMTTTDSWIECPSVAIDAGNPDVIYAVARISAANSLGAAVGNTTDATLIFAVSSDGGATFTQSVLHADTPIGYCGDVISPAANAVVVTDPVDVCGKDIWVWSDSNRGAAFAQGLTGSNGGYVANGTTTGLDEVDGRPCTDVSKVNIEQNGTTGLGGEATEAPRMFTDGAGRVCISYIGDVTGATGPTPIHSFVRCSTDLGHTFSAAISLDPTSPYGVDHSQAVGALGPHGAAAVAWVRSLDTTNQQAHLFIATSTDGGATFGGATQVPTYVLPGQTADAGVLNPSVLYDADGILWIAYRVDDGGTADRIVVDKSCDGGMTWSGAVLVNGTEAQITAATFANMKWPALLAGSGAAPNLAAWGTDHMSAFRLAP